MIDKNNTSKTEISANKKRLDGWLEHAVRWNFTAIPLVGCFFILDIPFYLEWTILREQYYGIMLAMLLPCSFIVYPRTRNKPADRIPWYDFILAILSICVGLYLAFFYREIALDLGTITWDRVTMGIIAILLILEAARRVANLFLALFGLLALLFPHFSWLFPDLFSAGTLPISQQVNYLFLDTNGMLSLILGVAIVIVLAFILFGSLLFNVGGGAFITDISMATFGGFRGGPGKIAVVGSSMFATISGVAVANVATTGVVTIPLMKKIGYKPHLAGAIESVASTGGQICPPIMGATAFVMAEVIGVPYREIAIAAIIPALLYYSSIFFQVDMEAGKSGLRGLQREHLPKISRVLRKSYLFFIPFAVLIIALFVLYFSPQKSALSAVVSILLFGFFIQTGTRFRIGWILQALDQTGRALLTITPIAALAGLVVGTVSYTGLGFLIPLYLSQIAGGNLLLILPIIAISCFILGMGMPTLPAYIVLAVLMAPTVVQLGIDIIAAHLFILYFATASMVTPPICIAAYAGAAIAGSDPMRTGFAAARFGAIAYIVPFLFIFFPELLFKGAWSEIVFAVATAILGCFTLSAGLSGYLFRRLSLIKRVILGIAGISLLIPIQSHLTVISSLVNILGGGVALLLILLEWHRRFDKGNPEADINTISV